MIGKVKQIESIYIPVSDPSESAKWYQQNLGLELMNHVTEDQAQLKVGERQAIFLIKSKHPTTLNYTEIGGHLQSVITLEVEELEDIYHIIKNNGSRVKNIERTNGCGDLFDVLDPDGNIITLWGGWPTKETDTHNYMKTYNQS